MPRINCREFESFDISSQIKKDITTQKLLIELRPIIEDIISQVKNNMFDFTPYFLGRNQGSGLSEKAGFYLFINKNNKKVYLGSSGDLARRKADYNRDLNNLNRINNPNIKADVIATGRDGFYFVPILKFSLTDCIVPTDLGGKSKKAFISEFLDTQVESTLLQGYLAADSTIKDMFYNVAVVGRFLPGNTRGGTPQSGVTSKPVSFNREYAWESILAAAKSFKVDRHTVSARADSGLLTRLSKDDYESFPDNLKISGKTAENYFNDKSEVLQRIKLSLGLR